MAQIMPGPNVVNLSLMLGGRFLVRGRWPRWRACSPLPLCLMLLLMIAVSSWVEAPPWGALRGLGLWLPG